VGKRQPFTAGVGDVQTRSTSPLPVNTTTQESDEQSDQDDTDERAGWRQLAIAFVGGTAMFLGYLCALGIAYFLPSPVGDVAFYGLPLAGLVAGVRWRLSTAVASVCVVLMYAGIWQAFSVEPFISVLAWIPVVAPVAGIAYGVVVKRTEFSLRNVLSDSRLMIQRFR
jgi:hypothetical protein